MKAKKANKAHSKFYPTPQHYKAFQWCTNNGIRVFPKLRSAGYILVYEIDGFGHSSGKVHSAAYYQEAIWQFYLYLYKKYRDVRDKNLPADGGVLRS